MRFTKQKRHRKIIKFYTACFGFHDPFKVLCDGTFVHHLLLNELTPADTALANALSAPVKMFTTRCLLAELASLGGSHAESLAAARNLLIARCDHEKRKSGVDCIADVIGQDNSERFFVATQDAELRKKLQEIPGVPLMYGLRKALLLERPSSFQHEFVKSVEEKRSHMPEWEQKVLTAVTKSSTFEESKDSSDAEVNGGHASGVQSVHMQRYSRDGKDKVQIKRKKAKAPNPLSCKKKKMKPPVSKNNGGPVSVKEGSNTDTSMRSRNKKRKRRKSNTAEDKTA